MADTLLDVVKRVLVKLNLNSDVTAFSDADRTLFIVELINDANYELRSAISELPYLDKRGTLTTVASQRLYDLAADATALELYDWSIINDTNNTVLTHTTLKEITRLDPHYSETLEGEPKYIYTEGAQVGLYPIPNAVYEIDYIYKKELTRLSSTTATFDYPDDWVRFIELSAIAAYKMDRAMGDGETAYIKAQMKLEELIAKGLFERPQYF